jgi:hypothetical protein
VAGGIEGYGDGLLLRAARADEFPDVGTDNRLAFAFKKWHIVLHEQLPYLQCNI